MDFYEVIKTRRSVRNFKNDEIPEDVFNRILDAARIAPSGSNRQPTRLIVVKDKNLQQKLVPLCHNQSFIADAPVIIVACGKNINYNRGGYMGEMSMLVDVTIAFDHLTLAARAEGLGTCWIGSFDNDAIKQLLKVQSNHEVVALTPLGYPTSKNEFREALNRLPMNKFVSTDKFK